MTVRLAFSPLAYLNPTSQFPSMFAAQTAHAIFSSNTLGQVLLDGFVSASAEREIHPFGFCRHTSSLLSPA
ncbi:hypothetical protein D3C77_215900 [compost metagenome]